MNKKYLISVLMIAVVTILGCATVTSTGGGTSGGGREYFPNTDGYSWSYNYRPMSGSQMEMNITFSGSITSGGKTFQVFKGNIGIITFESYVIVTDSNVKTYNTLTSEASTLLVFPLNVGSHWFNSGSDESQVLALETVTVQAGTFNNCYKVRTTRQASFYDDWYAPNVGLIKEINSSATLELVSKNF